MSSEVLIVYALFQISDAANAAISGIFRGTGNQALGARLNFIAYYVFGIPTSILMGFYFHLGLSGLWMGIFVGLGIVAIIGCILVSRIDWQKWASMARRDSADALGEKETEIAMGLN